MKIVIEPIEGIPLIKQGDDLAAIIAEKAGLLDPPPGDDDIFVIAQKIVSKAEGRQIDLQTVKPSQRALDLAGETGKDPRLVELILRESNDVVRHRKDVLIVAHKLGIVHANAGIDQSNVDGRQAALLLPVDPDTSARNLREHLEKAFGARLAVIIADSTGRAWRKGTVGIAIGVAGVEALQDQRGRPDLFGRALEITEVGHADQLAAAATIVMGQADEALPMVRIRGLQLADLDGSATDLVRPKNEDLFR